MTLRLVLVLVVWLMAQTGDAITVEPGKQLPQSMTVRAQTPEGAKEATLHYLLFTPRNYTAEGEPLPLLLFLHGRGECGNNELERVKIHGPAKLVETRPDFPFVLVSPQCPPPGNGLKNIGSAWKADQLLQLLDHIEENLNIDRRRLYVTGLSMGGYGTWRLAAANPDRFAAAVPICGGGDPEKMAEPLSRVPIWAFHGALDKVVPLSESQEMVDAVREAGGDVRLTVYPEVEHNSWAATYDNQEVYDWLLSHRLPEK